ncbi:MAG: hypothetical protein ACRCX2_28130 [Paraclostridium sp.]
MKSNDENKKEFGGALAGTMLGTAGVKKIKDEIDRGNITGREKLYHNTHKKNIDSILENGLSGRKATDKKVAVTPEALSHLNKRSLKDKVYFARKKKIADGVGSWAALQSARKKIAFKPASPTELAKVLVNEHASRRTLRASIPTWKLNEVDNPELLGSKNVEEYMQKYNKKAASGKSIEKTKRHLKRDFETLSTKGTATIKGNVPSKYIKGSKDFSHASVQEIGEFISKNPQRFKKGALKSLTGAGMVGAGAALLSNAIDKKEKTAFEIIDTTFEKINNMA